MLTIILVVCQLLAVQESQFYMSLPNSMFSDVTWVTWHWSRQEYLRHGNQQTLQIGGWGFHFCTDLVFQHRTECHFRRRQWLRGFSDVFDDKIPLSP